MTIIPSAAALPACLAVGDVQTAHGKLSKILSESEIRNVAEAAILAALPHLGEPAEWQRYVARQSMGWWQFVDSEDIPHYRAKGAILRPLYLAPPGPAVAVKPLEWEECDWHWQRGASPIISPSVYLVRPCLADRWAGQWMTYAPGSSPDERSRIGEFYPTADAAKAAAQADYEQRIRSALVDVPAPAPSIPVGWKLVPVEPTIEMVTAPAIDHEDSATPDASERVYRAMLAAAPEPPVVCSGAASGDTQQPLPVTDEAQIDPVKAQMAEALRPFAEFVRDVDPFWDDQRRISTLNLEFNKLTVGLFRAAAAALAAYETEARHG